MRVAGDTIGAGRRWGTAAAHAFLAGVWLLGSLSASPAHAITTARSGPYLEAGIGGLAAMPPISGGLAWEAGLGWWIGPYDNAYSIGRYTGFGLGLRQDLRGNVLHTGGVVEVRRGFDVIVFGGHAFVAAGALAHEGELTGLVDAGIGGKGRFRFTGPYSGVTTRLHVGAEVGAGDVEARAMLTVGFQLSGPAGKEP